MAQTSTAAESSIDRKLLNKLTEAEMARFREHTPTSAEYFDRARKVMPGGVPSSFQLNDPWPVYIDRGKGALVWDVDGGEYVDFHNGFGVMCIGHANPTVGEAVKARHDEGTHFAAPTNGSIVVAQNLVERFKLPQWRFSNSGTESTMSAIHLARGATERDLIIKVEGSYDGHHDAVMVSCYPGIDELGPREDPTPVPFGSGYPQAVVELTRPVPFNDPDVLEAILKRYEGKVAGMIIEPSMMNINIIPPKEGYLQARARALRRARRAADLRRGQDRRHDLLRRRCAALRRAAGHGLPREGDLRRLPGRRDRDDRGARRGRRLRQGAPDRHLQRQPAGDGRRRGDPDRGAYARRLREARGDQQRAPEERCQEVIDKYGLPAYTQGLGAKGCVIFSPEPIYEYRDYLTKVDGELSTLAWLYHMNHGIFMTPGVEEEWTLSIAHEQEHIDRYVAAFEAFASDVSGA